MVIRLKEIEQDLFNSITNIMKRNSIKLLIITLVLIVAGCRGGQQTKLIGVWESIPFTEPNDFHTYWQFYSGDLLEVYRVDASGATPDTLTKTGYQYEISGNVFSIFAADTASATGYSPGAADPRGEYWVDELSKTNFKVTKRKNPDGSTQSAYLRVELVKR